MNKIILFLLTSSVALAMVNVKNINSNGILFRELGYTSTYTTEEIWKVVTMISIKEYLAQPNKIMNRITELKGLKRELTNNITIANVDAIVFELGKLSESIDQLNVVIIGKQLDHRRSTRETSAAFPFVGSAIEWAFGNPDQKTIGNIKEKIDDLES